MLEIKILKTKRELEHLACWISSGYLDSSFCENMPLSSPTAAARPKTGSGPVERHGDCVCRGVVPIHPSLRGSRASRRRWSGYPVRAVVIRASPKDVSHGMHRTVPTTPRGRCEQRGQVQPSEQHVRAIYIGSMCLCRLAALFAESADPKGSSGKGGGESAGCDCASSITRARAIVWPGL